MKYFVEKLVENAKKYPDRIALVSPYGKKYTYKDLDYYSGKVYAYLKEKNIGKENVVMCCVPHSEIAIIIMLGILKAGAAFMIVENMRAVERIKFMKKDLNPSFFIDETYFEKIFEYDYLEGFEKIDNNDACYVIYTSGSTGAPKGIIHEYGKLEHMIKSSDVIMSMCPNDDTTHFALVTPLDFAATIMELIPRFYKTHTIYMSSLDMVKNPKAFEKFFIENKITDTGMTASLIKQYKNTSPYLKNILCRGETSNGLHIEGVRIINQYALSETLFTVASFEIDKMYDITPAGKKTISDIDILILDDDGKVLSKGQTGEICFKNEYFRGYLNLPEQNKKAVVNGLFHSGDMGYIDDSGNLIVAGRKDDMIKINGNRIEPAEIEATIKTLLSINTAIAKGFYDKGREYIVLYYLKSEAKEIFTNLDINDLRCKLLQYLPYYMIPTYYEGLDEIPLNANGKLNKKELLPPNIEAKKTIYKAPKTDTEKLICEKMEKVLGIKSISVNDDFFMLGGDSLLTIDLINECNDLKLNSRVVYKYRTPYEIAKYLDNIKDNNKDVQYLDEQNEIAKKEEQNLLPVQIMFMDQQFFGAKTDMWNVPILMKLKNDINIVKFKRVLDKVLSHHPIFKTKIKIGENGNFVQYYDNKIFIDVPIIEMSDEKFENVRKNLIKYFYLCNNLLYRVFLYKTESSIYFFMDMHHMICDGSAIMIFMEQVYECYMNDDYDLPTDYYYLYLKNLSDVNDNEINNQKAKYDELYSKYTELDSWKSRLKVDRESIEYKKDKIDGILDISISPKHNSVFFFTAIAMALAKFNNVNYALFKWAYSNRDTIDKHNIFGNMSVDFPIILEIKNNSDKKELLKNVKQQVELSMVNDKYSYVYEHPKMFNDSVLALNQTSINLFEKINGLIEWGEFLFDGHKYSENLCCVEIFDNEETSTFKMSIHFSKSSYDSSSIKYFYKLIEEAMKYLDES